MSRFKTFNVLVNFGALTDTLKIYNGTFIKWYRSSQWNKTSRAEEYVVLTILRLNIKADNHL